MKTKTLSILLLIISLLLFTRTSSSFMIQTDTDDYTESIYNSLSDLSGYTLSIENSTCTNGGVLSWDSSTGTISLTTSSSDMCTVYLDKVEAPVITSATISYESCYSFYLSEVTFEESVEIEKYVVEVYSCNELMSTYEFTELNVEQSLTDIDCYTFLVYAVDVNTKSSNSIKASKNKLTLMVCDSGCECIAT